MRGGSGGKGVKPAGSGEGGRPLAFVVHIITLLEWGGAQENTLYTVGELDPERYERVLLSGGGGMLDAVAENIPACRFLRVNSLVREIRPLSDLRAFASLTSMLREEKRRAGGVPLVVHTHSSKAGILGRAAARTAGADVIIHSIHGFGFHDGQPPLVRKFFVGLERMASRWTDMFVAVSEENIRTGVREGIFPGDRCRLIRSGFDTGRFTSGSRAEGRRLIGLAGDAPVVGTISVFKHQKAPLDFVNVARRVAAEVPGARFVMVGDGELRPEVDRALAKGSLDGRFHMMGWRREIPDLLRAFDVFLLTSLWEGLPKVVPQAMLSGVPVVATAVDGTREIIDDGKDGFLCRPGDVETMAKRVVAVLSGASRLDPSFKRDRLLAEFDQGKMVRAQECLYEELLARKGFPCPSSS
jgi:glycosyltransferase involved in cell wall biosynthesis